MCSWQYATSDVLYNGIEAHYYVTIAELTNSGANDVVLSIENRTFRPQRPSLAVRLNFYRVVLFHEYSSADVMTGHDEKVKIREMYKYSLMIKRY